jgi:hypothetical protein
MRTISVILVLMLLVAGCSTSTTTAAQTGSSRPGESKVEFSLDGERVGSLLVRAASTQNNLVPFFVAIPYVGDGYRLNSLTLEFRSEAPAPSISLQASSGSLTENIAFKSDFDGADAIVRLTIADTGLSGDGSVRLEFLASPETFGDNGLRLHAELGLKTGDAEADLVILPGPDVLASDSCESFRTLSATVSGATLPLTASSYQCGSLNVDNTGLSSAPGTLLARTGDELSLQSGAQLAPTLVEARLYDGDGIAANFFQRPEDLPDGTQAILNTTLVP